MTNLPDRETLKEACEHAHDAGFLLRRWKRLAKQRGLQTKELQQPGDHPLLLIQSPDFAKHSRGGFYVSAGIHGDEPAGVLALLLWMEGLRPNQFRVPFFLIPILNPWGLVENSRRDRAGNDLNRIWNRKGHPLRRTIDRHLQGHRLSAAITLHEDYDATGIYLYELLHRGRKPLGGDLLAAPAGVLPLEQRKKIEGSRVGWPGWICRKKTPLHLVDTLPEALYLHQNHADHTFTFETPSERDLEKRVCAQLKFLHACAREFGVV